MSLHYSSLSLVNFTDLLHPTPKGTHQTPLCGKGMSDIFMDFKATSRYTTNYSQVPYIPLHTPHSSTMLCFKTISLFAFLLQGFVSWGVNCRHELTQTIHTPQLTNPCNRFLAETKWQTHSVINLCWKLQRTLSCILDHQKHKKKLAMTGCIQKVYCNFQWKLLQKLNFDSIGFSHTHTEACQLCTGSSQHPFIRKVINIYK